MAKLSRIQWYDASIGRYHKYDGDTGDLLATKMTGGRYAGIKVVKKQPLTAEQQKEMDGGRRRKINYISNSELMIEFTKSMEQEKMTDRFVHMLDLLVYRISQKGNFANYTYIDDMRGAAMLSLLGTWSRFNPEKSSNPFSYYTTCITHVFVAYLNSEAKVRDTRDRLLVNAGLNPSHTYQTKYEAEQREDREEREEAKKAIDQ